MAGGGWSRVGNRLESCPAAAEIRSRPQRWGPIRECRLDFNSIPARCPCRKPRVMSHSSPAKRSTCGHGGTRKMHELLSRALVVDGGGGRSYECAAGAIRQRWAANSCSTTNRAAVVIASGGRTGMMLADELTPTASRCGRSISSGILAGWVAERRRADLSRTRSARFGRMLRRRRQVGASGVSRRCDGDAA